MIKIAFTAIAVFLCFFNASNLTKQQQQQTKQKDTESRYRRRATYKRDYERALKKTTEKCQRARSVWDSFIIARVSVRRRDLVCDLASLSLWSEPL